MAKRNIDTPRMRATEFFSRASDGFIDRLNGHWWAPSALILTFAALLLVYQAHRQRSEREQRSARCEERCQSTNSAWSSDMHVCLCFTQRDGIVVKKGEP